MSEIYINKEGGIVLHLGNAVMATLTYWGCSEPSLTMILNKSQLIELRKTLNNFKEEVKYEE